jgi:hypothetical protein
MAERLGARDGLQNRETNQAHKKIRARLGAQAARLHRAEGTINRVGRTHLL